ncbi:MAG: UDP-N-acetylmuramate dehydrogenase [Thermoanaerobaculia bacterium]|nr:UDP-N-acetylmuramate dehydrogenase [Thermoanaerobaculia bacterium]
MTAPPDLRSDVPLAPLTSLGIGGPAEFFLQITDRSQLQGALDWASQRGLPVTLLAGGSNVVIADAGIRGLVLHLQTSGTRVEERGDGLLVTAEAGEPWDPFVARCVDRGWAGLECLSGIPGTVGATPIQNVGAYGQEVADTLVAVEVFEPGTGLTLMLPAADCEFGYRTSRFKGRDRDRWIVVSATFRLRPGGAPLIAYPDLERAVGAAHGPASLETVREAVLELRRSKGMVLDPLDPDTRSDGSFFVNPVLDTEAFERLRGRESDGTGEVPGFPMGADAGGGTKVPAAWLIERAGFSKGHIEGGVGLSSKHTLALINRGSGTAEEVLTLMRKIQDGVHRRFDVSLHPEPRFLGFSEEDRRAAT